MMNWNKISALLFPSDAVHSAGLLVLRLCFGLWMGLRHGRTALLDLLAGNNDFPDPLQMGAGWTKLLMGVGAEFVCALLVAVGLFTRFAGGVLAFGFGIAVFIHHAADDLGVKEQSFSYFVVFLTICLAGPGKYSLDWFWFGKKIRSFAA